ncbi:MdBV-6 [Microplitis demolitor]|nr:MdBV-6 [Microplitis demolitor]
MNRGQYAVLCREGIVEVRKGNRDKDVILDPKLIDFLKMVAADKIWGNEGSILAISNGLGIRVLVYSIIGFTATLAMIADFKPNKILSSRILTIFHMDCVHFYAAYPNNRDIIKTVEDVDKRIWENGPFYPFSANI